MKYYIKDFVTRGGSLRKKIVFPNTNFVRDNVFDTVGECITRAGQVGGIVNNVIKPIEKTIKEICPAYPRHY